jgi:uncharacterized protein
METFFWLIVAILIVLGILGTILPGLPGAPLVFVGLFIAAWIDGFEKVKMLTLIILFLLTVLSFIVDLTCAAFGAKKFGASRAALIGCVVGTVVGLFYGIVGLIAGPFVGAFIGEMIVRKNVWKAGVAGIATTLGLVVGVAIRLALVFAMLGIFVMAYVIK